MASDCIFCKILNKEMPADILYEDDKLMIFRDINPAAPVHLLIVPRKHIRSINNLAEDDRPILADLIFAAQKMAVEQGIDASGYKLLFNVEKGGGQMIFHLHLHLLGGRK